MKLAYLTYLEADSNKYRFYQLHVELGLFGEWALVREWGRLGSGGRVRFDWFETEQEAIEAGLALQKRKQKKGYR